MNSKRKISSTLTEEREPKRNRKSKDNTDLTLKIFSSYPLFKRFFYDAYIEDLLSLSLVNKGMRDVIRENIKIPPVSYTEHLRQNPEIPGGKIVYPCAIKLHFTFKFSDFTMTTVAKITEKERSPVCFGSIRPGEYPSVPFLLKILHGKVKLIDGYVEKARLRVYPLLEWEVQRGIKVYYPDPWGSYAEKLFTKIRKDHVDLFIKMHILEDENGKRRRWIKHAIIITKFGYFNPLKDGLEMRLDNTDSLFEGTDLKVEDMNIE